MTLIVSAVTFFVLICSTHSQQCCTDCNKNILMKIKTSTTLMAKKIDELEELLGCDVKTVNPCTLFCLNEGNCSTDATGHASCECLPGFSGDHCQYNACDGVTCNCRGSCKLNTTTGLTTCLCEGKYRGKSCEIGPCEGHTCNGQGSCTINPNTGDAQCICHTGFSGDRCQHNACDGVTCSSHGSCQLNTTTGQKMCLCDRYYKGEFCEIGPCDGNKCNDHGNCTINELTGAAQCICDAGYGGKWCENCRIYCPSRIISEVVFPGETTASICYSSISFFGYVPRYTPVEAMEGCKGLGARLAEFKSAAEYSYITNETIDNVVSERGRTYIIGYSNSIRRDKVLRGLSTDSVIPLPEGTPPVNVSENECYFATIYRDSTGVMKNGIVSCSGLAFGYICTLDIRELSCQIGAEN